MGVIMKRLGIIVFGAVLGLSAGMISDTRPAHPLGDWYSRDGNCAKPHHPRVRHRMVRRHKVQRPGIYVIKRKPGLYGWRKVRVKTRSGRVVWRKKRVLLRPYKNYVRYHEPRDRWGWERQKIVESAPPRPRGAWPDGC